MTQAVTKWQRGALKSDASDASYYQGKLQSLVAAGVAPRGGRSACSKLAAKHARRSVDKREKAKEYSGAVRLRVIDCSGRWKLMKGLALQMAAAARCRSQCKAQRLTVTSKVRISIGSSCTIGRLSAEPWCQMVDGAGEAMPG